MKHIIFEQNATYKVALLIKESALNKPKLQENYLNNCSVPAKDILAFDLPYNSNKKAPAKMAKAYLDKLLKSLDNLGVTTLFVCDGHYFKFLANVRKLEGQIGYVRDCAIEGYTHMKVIYSANYEGLFYNPNLIDHIDLSLRTLENQLDGIHMDIGTSIIHTAQYPSSAADIKKALKDLNQYPELACDIETFSLKFYETGIATIAFAWDKHNGIAFRVTLDREVNSAEHNEILHLLQEFFVGYSGKLIYQNANFDIKVIVNALFMDNLLDQKGLRYGIAVMTKSIDDTKIISYLATNSTAGNKLGLKHQAHEFAGNYGLDVNDITKIPTQELLIYNLKDCLATNYVKEKNFPVMVKDSQLGVYNDVLIPSISVILQMELTGMPIDMGAVIKLKYKLIIAIDKFIKDINESPIVKKHIISLRKEEFINQNLLWKKKKEPLEYFDYVKFNPASNQQLQELLYNRLELPIIDLTKTKLPAVGAKTLRKLIHKTDDIIVINLIENLVGLSEAKKILNTFIEAFINNSIKKDDGIYYLHGNFNIGGTVSGRLSSSSPNLQNIPSSSTFAKEIKKCFIAPPGWLMCGADFDSLEDRISALTTKDPNKLKVYTDGYDGHCLRAYSYFGSQMVGIGDSVEDINRIALHYPELRQKSKAPTFLLTYGGTAHGLVSTVGLPEREARAIEDNYHELYKVSDEWVQDKLVSASTDGYVTCAFGLRVRTPILAQTVLGAKSTPYEAQSEARTAGNALGQSYGLLNNRAAIEFQRRVLASPYRDMIKPIAQIHDAMYFIAENKLGCIKWFNDNLPECMAWQELPEIQHDAVKLSGSVDIFYPDWNTAITLPNKATKKDIVALC